MKHGKKILSPKSSLMKASCMIRLMPSALSINKQSKIRRDHRAVHSQAWIPPADQQVRSAVVLP